MSIVARGQVRINRAALRAVLGTSGVSETLEQKAAGRPTVNVAQMWAYFTTSVYSSGDLPVIATREALQNGLDAIRAAIKERQIGAKDGQFFVVWDQDKRSLSWRDNGLGMDTDTILNKFLSLGDSGKKEAADSNQSAGGFGVAKAVILGLSPSFKWELISRDNHAISNGTGDDVAIFDFPRLQGTKITVFDVPPKFDKKYSYVRDRDEPLLERLKVVLAANDLPEVEISLNGELIKPLFSRRGGSRVAAGGNWGPGTTALVKAYRRPPGDRRGAFYVRVGGLFQFVKTSAVKLPADVVVDLTTTLRPGAPGYPLNAARDTLLADAAYALMDLMREIEQENESAGEEEEYEIFLPASDGTISDATTSALADPLLQHAMQEAAGGVSDYYRELAAIKRTAPPPSSNAPGENRSLNEGASISIELAAPALGSNNVGGAVTIVKKILTDAGRMEGPAAAALDRIASGTADAEDLQAVGGILDTAEGIAVEKAIGAGGGGLLQANMTQFAMRPLSVLLPQKRSSPFGRMAGLRVSKTHYDRAKAGRFRRDFAKWIPYLVAWDATLRLVAAEGGIRTRFTPGFILNDSVSGMAAKESTPSGHSRAVVYVNPDTMRAVVQAHKQRPLSIAYWLHGLACHELSHLDGRMGDGHSEGFVVAREELGFATSHLLSPISELLARVLDLKTRKASRATRSSPRILAERGIQWLQLELQRAPPEGTSGKEVAQVIARLRPALVETLASLIADQLSKVA